MRVLEGRLHDHLHRLRAHALDSKAKVLLHQSAEGRRLEDAHAGVAQLARARIPLPVEDVLGLAHARGGGGRVGFHLGWARVCVRAGGLLFSRNLLFCDP